AGITGGRSVGGPGTTGGRSVGGAASHRGECMPANRQPSDSWNGVLHRCGGVAYSTPCSARPDFTSTAPGVRQPWVAPEPQDLPSPGLHGPGLFGAPRAAT